MDRLAKPNGGSAYLPAEALGFIGLRLYSATRVEGSPHTDMLAERCLLAMKILIEP